MKKGLLCLVKSMEFYEVVKRRRSVRKFKPNRVDEKVLERILEAGLWAPSAGNLQPWRFVVVRNRTLKEKLAKIHTEYSRKAWGTFEPEIAKDLASRGGTWDKEYSANAPVWIVICYKLTSQRGFDENAFASTWCAIENILLAATAEGLGCCPYTLTGGEEQAIREVLPIPRDCRMAAIIHLGYTDVKLNQPKRKGFKVVVGYERFP